MSYWNYEYYDYDDIDDEYHRIIQSPNSTNDIDSVSMLRHYVNCWGINNNLLKRFKPLTEDELEEIINICPGRYSVDNFRKNFEEKIQEIRKENAEKRERLFNKEMLIVQLHNMRNNFCGIDTRNIKTMLNNLGKTDSIAQAYRYILEAEKLLKFVLKIILNLVL